MKINKELFDKVATSVIKHIGIIAKNPSKSPRFEYPGLEIPFEFEVEFNPHSKIGVVVVNMGLETILTHSFKPGKQPLMPYEFIEALSIRIGKIISGNIMELTDFYLGLREILEGHSPLLEISHPFGFVVQYNNDVDGQQFMIKLSDELGTVLYALEDGINMDQGIGSICLATPDELVDKVKRVQQHFIENDMCPELEGSIGE